MWDIPLRMRHSKVRLFTYSLFCIRLLYYTEGEKAMYSSSCRIKRGLKPVGYRYRCWPSMWLNCAPFPRTFRAIVAHELVLINSLCSRRAIRRRSFRERSERFSDGARSPPARIVRTLENSEHSSESTHAHTRARARLHIETVTL